MSNSWTRVWTHSQAKDAEVEPEMGKRLWEVSEKKVHQTNFDITIKFEDLECLTDHFLTVALLKPGLETWELKQNMSLIYQNIFLLTIWYSIPYSNKVSKLELLTLTAGGKALRLRTPYFR